MKFAARTANLLVAFALASPAPAQVTTHVGVEPNQTKLEATLLTGLGQGDLIRSSASPQSSGESNIFILRPEARPLGIYRHELLAVGTSAPEPMAIVGRDAVRNFVYPLSTGDVQLATASSSSSKFLSWYGFGKSEDVVVDLPIPNFHRGGAVYATHTAWPVPEIDFGTVGVGRIGIAVNGVGPGAHGFDLQVFDAAFNALPQGGRHHLPFFSGSDWRSTPPPGEYHIAVSDELLATHLPPNSVDPPGSTLVLDHPGAICGSGPDVDQAFNLTLRDYSNGGTILRQYAGVKRKPFEVVWFRLVIGTSQSVSEFCPGDGLLTACPCGIPAPSNSGMGCVNSTGRGATALVARTLETFSGGGGRGSWLITLEDLPANTAALAFVSFGVAAPGGVGGGLLCLAHGAVRIGPFSADLNGTAAFEVADLPVRGLPVGQTAYLQAAYRDLAAAPGCQLNLTSGYSFVVD